jgi:glutamate/tyrosine decarboxylase-like PLP-dependent enzyme
VELDRLNLAVLEELRAGGQAFLSSTRLGGRVAVRMCFINWRTTAGHVDEVVQLLTEIGTRLSRPPGEEA